MREYPDRPIVAVGAITLRDEDVLLIRRAKEPYAGKWSLPGGAQEIGETVEEAAIREVFEETGVKIGVASIVDVIDSISKDESGEITYHYTLIDFLCFWKGGNPFGFDDALEAKWFPLTEIESLGMWSETVRIIQKAVELRSTQKNQ